MGLLKDFGFRTRSIRSSTQRRSPDFSGAKEGQRFVFELKERADDLAAIEDQRRRMRRGEIVSSFESIGPNARIAAKARDGVEQLQSFRLSRNGFRLLWLHAGGRDPETQIEQFRATLYGIMPIFDQGRSRLKRCYYFTESEFFRHRAVLSGAILTTQSTLQICINSLSPRVDEFRASALVRTFHNALLDPAREEKKHLIFIADCKHDRRNKQAVLNYLQTKYRRPRLMDMPMTKATAHIMVPTKGNEARDI